MQGRRIILTKPPFDSLITREHLLRKVDQVLDLSFVYGLTKSYYCANNGRPSIDPILYFKIQFLAYLYNIPSERRICHELKYNLVYRWFCRLQLKDKIPHHSSLTRIRNRFGVHVFLSVFENIVRLCISNKLVSGDIIMTDSTLIKAKRYQAKLMLVRQTQMQLLRKKLVKNKA